MATPCGLFFDGGSKVGWACMAYDPTFELIAKGTFGTTSEGKGIWGWRLHVIDKRVQALFSKYRPARVGFEAPWTPTLRKNSQAQQGFDPMAARFLACVAGKFEEIAARNGLGSDDISEVVPATARLLMTGSASTRHADGRKMTTKEQKDRMIAACHRRGFEVADEHQADAVAVGLVCIDNHLRGRS